MKIHRLGLTVLIVLVTIGCASNKKTEQPSVEMEGFEQPKPISVGTAEVMLEFVTLSEESVTVQIVEVLGYGASTERLNTSDPLSINYRESVKEYISGLEEGNRFSAVLSMQPGGMNMPSASWEITEILDQ